MICRILAAWVAVSILFFSVVLPARAIGFVAVLGSPALFKAGVATLGLASGAALYPYVAGAIGAAVDYLQIDDSQGNSTRIGLSDNPAAAPAPPVAPLTAQPVDTRTWTLPWGGSYGSASDACQNAFTPGACVGSITPSFQGNGDSAICVLTTNNLPAEGCNGSSVAGPMASAVVTSACPSGYSSSTDGCVLVEPRKVTPDKKCDLVPVNGKFSFNDADCPNGPSIDHSTAVPGLRRNGEVVFMYGSNVAGQPVLANVIINPDGTREVLYHRQVLANVETTRINLSPAATITNVSTSVSPGQITSPASVPAQASSTPTVLDTPIATTDATKNPVIQFPDDYARESTAASTKSGIDQLHRDLTDTTNQADPTLPTSQEFTDSFFKDTFNGLKGWQLPSHSSQCPTGTFNLFGQAFVMDSHCSLINGNWGALQAAMGVVWSLMALFIVLRA